MKAYSHFRKLKKIGEIGVTGDGLVQPAVLVMCGSFNPIHNAHINSFSAAEKRLRRENIVILGSFVSPVSDSYRKKDLAPFEDRKRIIELSIQDHLTLEIDSWEGTQPVYTRTYYVLKHLEEEIRAYYKESEPEAFEKLNSKNITVDVIFTCGADLFETFFLPKVWPWDLLQCLIDDFRIVVIKRSGGTTNSLENVWEKTGFSRITKESEGKMIELDLSHAGFFFCTLDVPDDTSSTKIRAIVQNNAVESNPDDTNFDSCLLSLVSLRAISAVKECYSKKKC